jgi:hypothetical protein
MEAAAAEKQLEQQPAAPSTHTAPVTPIHPSAALMAASSVVSERWGVPDALGNREHIAILKTSGFKFPWVRIVEPWSGKTGQLVSRVAMVADQVMLVPKPGIDPAVLDQALTESGFTIRSRESGSFMLAAFSGDITRIEQVPHRPHRPTRQGHLLRRLERRCQPQRIEHRAPWCPGRKPRHPRF